jgi:hypothetical protein
MARIAPPQPNEAMARIAFAEMAPFHSIQAIGSKFTSKVLWTRFEIVLGGPNRFKKRIGFGYSRKLGARDQTPRTTITHNFTFSVTAILAEPPCSIATFVVNSEPHTGARPSVRLCVGLTAVAFPPPHNLDVPGSYFWCIKLGAQRSSSHAETVC